MKKNQEIFKKTFLYLFSMLLFVGGMIHLLLFLLLPKLYVKENKEVLSRHGESVRETVSTIDGEAAAEFLEVYAKRNNLNMILDTENGKQFFQGFSPFLEVTMDTDEFRFKGMEDTESILVNNYPVTTKDGISGKLQVMLNMQPTRQAQRVTFSILPYTLCLSALFSILFSYVFSKKITKPVLEKIYEVERGKVDFLRAASHELKTPLASLHILLENMRYNIGRYKDHETYLETGMHLVEELSGMVQEILDSSKIQGEMNRLPGKKLNVKKELERLIGKYELLAKEKGLQVVCALEGEPGVTMNEDLFEKVFSNLLSNAVRYSREDGEIQVTGDDREIRIFNTCEPLTKEQMEHIFEPFYRPDTARDSRTGGNGLGLYLVKTILDANGIPFAFRREADGMCFLIHFRQ